jgi:hypothetical protein
VWSSSSSFPSATSTSLWSTAPRVAVVVDVAWGAEFGDGKPVDGGNGWLPCDDDSDDIGPPTTPGPPAAPSAATEEWALATGLGWASSFRTDMDRADSDARMFLDTVGWRRGDGRR